MRPIVRNKKKYIILENENIIILVNNIYGEKEEFADELFGENSGDNETRRRRFETRSTMKQVENSKSRETEIKRAKAFT